VKTRPDSRSNEAYEGRLCEPYLCMCTRACTCVLGVCNAGVHVHTCVRVYAMRLLCMCACMW